MASASSSASPPRAHGLLSNAAVWLATGLGTGYSPVVPGTVGSALGVASFWLVHALPIWGQVAALAVVTALGIAAASHTAERVGRKDPGIVVIDEVVGQWAALLFLPLNLATAGIAFVMFRAMDVLKPWPARDLEGLPGGYGIVADDLMAGVYANLLVRVVLIVLPLA
jgi:phosphatidylglycerophosphatase A